MIVTKLDFTKYNTNSRGDLISKIKMLEDQIETIKGEYSIMLDDCLLDKEYLIREGNNLRLRCKDYEF